MTERGAAVIANDDDDDDDDDNDAVEIKMANDCIDDIMFSIKVMISNFALTSFVYFER